MENDEINRLMRNLVLEYHHCYNHDLSINNDVGLFGSDAYDFMEKFTKCFNISMDGFNPDKYYLVESTIPFQYYYFKFFRPKRLYKPPLTVRHLIEVAKLGRWYDKEG